MLSNDQYDHIVNLVSLLVTELHLNETEDDAELRNILDDFADKPDIQPENLVEGSSLQSLYAIYTNPAKIDCTPAHIDSMASEIDYNYAIGANDFTDARNIIINEVRNKIGIFCGSLSNSLVLSGTEPPKFETSAFSHDVRARLKALKANIPQYESRHRGESSPRDVIPTPGLAAASHNTVTAPSHGDTPAPQPDADVAIDDETPAEDLLAFNAFDYLMILGELNDAIKIYNIFLGRTLLDTNDPQYLSIKEDQKQAHYFKKFELEKLATTLKEKYEQHYQQTEDDFSDQEMLIPTSLEQQLQTAKTEVRALRKVDVLKKPLRAIFQIRMMIREMLSSEKEFVNRCHRVDAKDLMNKCKGVVALLEHGVKHGKEDESGLVTQGVDCLKQLKLYAEFKNYIQMDKAAAMEFSQDLIGGLNFLYSNLISDAFLIAFENLHTQLSIDYEDISSTLTKVAGEVSGPAKANLEAAQMLLAAPFQRALKYAIIVKSSLEEMQTLVDFSQPLALCKHHKITSAEEKLKGLYTFTKKRAEQVNDAKRKIECDRVSLRAIRHAQKCADRLANCLQNEMTSMRDSSDRRLKNTKQQYLVTLQTKLTELEDYIIGRRRVNDHRKESVQFAGKFSKILGDLKFDFDGADSGIFSRVATFITNLGKTKNVVFDHLVKIESPNGVSWFGRLEDPSHVVQLAMEDAKRASLARATGEAARSASAGSPSRGLSPGGSPS